MEIMCGLKFGILLASLCGYLTLAGAKEIKVSSLLHPPYLYGENGSFTGYLPDLLNMLSDQLGLNFTIELTPDFKFGSRKPDGKWTGMMGELVDKSVDMAGPLTVTSTRDQFVDFSYPFQSLGPVIVMRRPARSKTPIGESLSKLLVPFEFSVWLMTVLACLVTSTVLYIISHTNPYEWRRMAKDKEATLREAESFTCLNSFWFIISTMAWQGYVRAPRSMGGRVTVTAWWFFVIIFLLSYTACLTNFLRIGPTPLEVEGYSKIKSFRDLSQNDDVKVSSLRFGSTEDYLRKSQDEVYKLIYKKVKQANEDMNITSLEIGFKWLRSSKVSDMALILESGMAKHVVNQKPCDLYMVGERLVNRQLAFAFQENSLHADKINRALMRLQENGDLAILEKQWYKSHCEHTVYEVTDQYYEVPRFYQMNLGTFSGALLILAIGIVLGGLVTIVEMCIFKWAETHVEEDRIDQKPTGKPNETSQKLLEPKAEGQNAATRV